MASQFVLEKIKQDIESDRFIKEINITTLLEGHGFMDSYPAEFDRDIKVFMLKHYPSFTINLTSDYVGRRVLELDNNECNCKDCLS